MATLGEIARAALQEIGGFEVPATFGGNLNLTAVRCVALLNREGKTLEMENRWTELISTYTFTTVNGTANYDLPSDFRAFANTSQWDRTNSRPLVGPAVPFVWQWLKGDVTAGNTIDRWFRIQAGDLYIHPTPDVDGDTIAFDYYSKSWVTDIRAGAEKVFGFRDDMAVALARRLFTADPAEQAKILAGIEARMGKEKTSKFLEAMSQAALVATTGTAGQVGQGMAVTAP